MTNSIPDFIYLEAALGKGKSMILIVGATNDDLSLPRWWAVDLMKAGHRNTAERKGFFLVRCKWKEFLIATLLTVQILFRHVSADLDFLQQFLY